MAYGESKADIREAKERLMMRNSPGASEDARIIARQQGAKTKKQVEAKAKLIATNRVNDAKKSLTRARLQDPNFKLARRFGGVTFNSPTVNKTYRPSK